MGLCLSCRKSKARFRDKGTKICTSLQSAVSPLHLASDEVITNSSNGLQAIIPPGQTSNKLSRGSMSNMIKGFVSKRRNRYKEDGFNLDLTYITDNIIAMGFPASSIEGVYRNHIDDVVKFLEAKHKDHYKIYNLCSERTYDTTKFHNRVEIFPFDDHNPPKIELIEPFCVDVDKWLSSDEANVAVVHCKAGKGRTGTMICCYLLHSRKFSTANDALSYYGKKRTQDRKGVTIPSQLRYVSYYARLVSQGLVYEPVALYIKEIRLEPPPIFVGGQGSVSFSISQQNLNESLSLGQCRPKCVKLYKSDVYEIRRGLGEFGVDLDRCIPIAGDLKVEFYNRKIRKERQFQFWVNTFFVANCMNGGETFVLTLSKNELDIVNKKDKQNKAFAADFKVTVVFQKVPTKSAHWMATPPKEPPSLPPDTTPSESSEADTTEDDSADESAWESGKKQSDVDRMEACAFLENTSQQLLEAIKIFKSLKNPSQNTKAAISRTNKVSYITNIKRQMTEPTTSNTPKLNVPVKKDLKEKVMNKNAVIIGPPKPIRNDFLTLGTANN